MKKSLASIICICAILCLSQESASAKAVYEDGTWGTVGDFFYSKWHGNTPNDWIKVGSAGYEAYFDLATPVETLPDYVPVVDPYDDEREHLYIALNATQVIPGGTWAGYEWTEPNDCLNSNGGISHNLKTRSVKYWLVAGWNGFPTPNGAAKVYLVDGYWDGLSDPAETGHVLWTRTPQGFLPNTKDLLARTDSSTIRLIVYVPGTIQLFDTSYLDAHGMQIFTEVYVPACGDGLHPYPTGDLNNDCNVDFKDFAEIASKWLNCNDPNPPCNAL